jgi:hypothetical protein
LILLDFENRIFGKKGQKPKLAKVLNKDTNLVLTLMRERDRQLLKNRGESIWPLCFSKSPSKSVDCPISGEEHPASITVLAT